MAIIALVHLDLAIPRVTVLMPVFNREQFVDEAIRSVLEQDFRELELVVVDDGSTDRTPELLADWARRDARVVVITLAKNRGIPAALNEGLRRARAPYVARLDSDDIMMPLRLGAQAGVLDQRADVVLVSCAYELIDRAGNHLATWRGDEPHEVVKYLLSFYNIVGGGGQVMFRLADVMAEGGFSEEVPSSEDYDLWVRLLRRGRIVTLPLVGMKQRDHEARSAVRYSSIKRANWKAIMSRSLGALLRRPVRDEEIAALITVWRKDGATGMAGIADRVMREAFGRFREEVPSPDLQKSARERTAQQWMEGAQHFARAGKRMESLLYLARAVSWSPSMVTGAAATRGRSMALALRSSALTAVKRTLRLYRPSKRTE